MQQAVDELEYLVTFNQSISQAMARTMQDLSEGVFISMANFTLACRDSCLEYLHAGVKQDTLTALRTAPVHLQSLFLDQLLIKAEEEVARNEERCSSNQSHRKPGPFYPYASNDKSSRQPDRKSSIPAWKQIRKRQQGKKGRGKPTSFSQKPAKGSKPRKWQLLCKVCYRTEGLCVPGQKGLNPSLVTAKDRDLTNKSETVNLLVNACVANAHSVFGLPQQKDVNPNYCHNYTEMKYVKDVSCVGHLSSVNLVTNVPTAAIDLPVGARLHQFWGKWETLGVSPKVVMALREGYTLPFQFRPNLTRSPTVVSSYTNTHKNLNLLEALYQLVNKNAVEPVENQNSLGFYNRFFLVPKPNNRWRPILDLSTLNSFLNTESFKMEIPETIRTSLQAGEWVTSLDFKDAYFHISIFQYFSHMSSQSVQEVHAFSRPW